MARAAWNHEYARHRSEDLLVRTITRIYALPAVLALAGLVMWVHAAAAQPIPGELSATHRYASFNLVVSKKLAAGSPFGFFHQSTLSADYDDETQDDIAVQDLLFFEPVNGFRLTAGGFYGKPGFSPTAGIQYQHAGRTHFVLLSPRINLESNPSFSIFSLARYQPALTETTRLYLAVQALNTFEPDRHIKSYQWLRAGLDIAGTQFGLAAHLDEFGPNPTVQLSLGLFVRREIL